MIQISFKLDNKWMLLKKLGNTRNYLKVLCSIIAFYPSDILEDNPWNFSESCTILYSTVSKRREDLDVIVKNFVI